MTIYLDWNIIVELFEGNYSEFLKSLVNRDDGIIMPFSTVHLNEGQKYNVDHREKNIIDFISNISRNQFLFIDPIETTINTKHPLQVNSFEKIKNEYFTFNSKFDYPEIMNFSKQMGFHNQELNNFDHTEIINKIDEILAAQIVGDKFRNAMGNNISFNNFITVLTDFIKAFYVNKFLLSKNIFTDKYLFEMKIQFSLQLLNALGYWSEKNSKFDSFGNDTHHSVYAAHCDYFITNDKRLYHKVKAVYHNYSIKTEVILFNKEFLKAIKLVSA